jgi:purine-binding chemotaxis protein CheW
VSDRSAEAILARRAARLRLPREEDDDGAFGLFFAKFTLGDDDFAIPLAELRAAIPLRAIAPVPLARPEVLGVVRFEGQLITAYSLASLLGGYGWTSDPSTLLVVEWGNGRLAVLDCHGVPQTIALPPRALDAARALDAHAVGAPARTAVTLVATKDVRPVRIIDLEALFGQVAR